MFVCTLFLNFNIDISRIENLIVDQSAMALYDALVLMGVVVSAVSAGCLLLTSAIMMFFYIKHYINVHKKELGILKALGYSNMKIAKSFWVFGLSVFLGAAAGFCSSFALMPTFYRTQNEDGILPTMTVNFNVELLLFLVIFPSIVFILLAIVYSYRKLNRSALELIRGEGIPHGRKVKRMKSTNSEMSFLQELRKSTVKSRLSLVFFIAFASFCYSAMMQMSFSMEELSSVMMKVIIIVIGIILASVTLFLAIITVVDANKKTISMMRVFGYSLRECCNAILNGYRPIAYIGFVIGTIYQYVLLKIMLSLFTETLENIHVYHFDVEAFIVVSISFILIYEVIMYCFSAKIKKISVKEIMLESN